MKRIVLIILIFTQLIYGQIDRSIEPKPKPDFSMSIPNIKRAELENGLRILVVEHHELPIVQVTMLIRSGADADQNGKFGTANLTADMLDEGTKSKTALQIAEELDFLGTELSTYANYDATVGSMLTLKEHLSKSLNILADIFLNPTFPESEFNRLKNELLTDLSSKKTRADIIATEIFYEKLYGRDHPYGQSNEGTEETVSEITIEDIKKFYSENYIPNNSSLIFVGDITLNEVLELVKKNFSKWKKNKFTPTKLLVKNRENNIEIFLIDKENAPQSQIRIGNIGIERNNPDFYAVNILNQIIGASNGRLFLNLREAKGYTYGAYANFSMRKSPGPFMAYAGVKTEVTDSALIEFFKELNRIREELVEENEFNMYKLAVIQRLPRVMETPTQIASQIMAIELFNLPDDFFSNLLDNYKKVTREDILKTAKKYINPEKAVIVIVGDVQKILSKIENLKLGNIFLCDEKGNLKNK